MELRVMSFNILYGGSYGLAAVIDVIRELRPDVVGVQEPYGTIDLIARELGWFGVPSLHVVSRFPVRVPPTSDTVWGFVELDGGVVAIANTHLPSLRYGSDLARNGATPEEIVRNEHASRVPWVRDVLATLGPVVRNGMPTFLTGDFNTPSHRDWTAALADSRADVVEPVAWPVSRFVEDAGFVDSFRSVHPDPVARPGYTWTPGTGFPKAAPDDELPDRIDFVYAAGAVAVLDSRVAGERGGPSTDIGFDPWPSDHRAVISTFEIPPAEARAGDRPDVVG
jgi:endonuclease/exonuclease/phosphatase family metal-dependent hydrolase